MARFCRNGRRAVRLVLDRTPPPFAANDRNETDAQCTQPGSCGAWSDGDQFGGTPVGDEMRWQSRRTQSGIGETGLFAEVAGNGSRLPADGLHALSLALPDSQTRLSVAFPRRASRRFGYGFIHCAS